MYRRLWNRIFLLGSYPSLECAFRSIGYNYRFVRFYETVIPIFSSLFPLNLRWKQTFFASVVTFSFLSLSLSLYFNLLFFIYIYILIFIPSRLSLHFFPSIIRVLESEENRWSGVTRNKRRKDLFALERQKNRLCKRILSNAIDFLLHIDSITMTRWWNKDRWTLVFWSEIS